MYSRGGSNLYRYIEASKGAGFFNKWSNVVFGRTKEGENNIVVDFWPPASSHFHVTYCEAYGEDYTPKRLISFVPLQSVSQTWPNCVTLVVVVDDDDDDEVEVSIIIVGWIVNIWLWDHISKWSSNSRWAERRSQLPTTTHRYRLIHDDSIIDFASLALSLLSLSK